MLALHETVKHPAGEYARGDVSMKSAEGCFGVFKKGMKDGCSKKHLNRYVTEFGFRLNNRASQFQLQFNYSDHGRCDLRHRRQAFDLSAD